MKRFPSHMDHHNPIFSNFHQRKPEQKQTSTLSTPAGLVKRTKFKPTPPQPLLPPPTRSSLPISSPSLILSSSSSSSSDSSSRSIISSSSITPTSSSSTLDINPYNGHYPPTTSETHTNDDHPTTNFMFQRHLNESSFHSNSLSTQPNSLDESFW